MITQFIIIILSILFGWFLRALTIKNIKEKTEQVRKKVMLNKSSMVDWTPPKSQEEEASEEVLKEMKL